MEQRKHGAICQHAAALAVARRRRRLFRPVQNFRRPTNCATDRQSGESKGPASLPSLGPCLKLLSTEVELGTCARFWRHYCVVGDIWGIQHGTPRTGRVAFRANAVSLSVACTIFCTMARDTVATAGPGWLRAFAYPDAIPVRRSTSVLPPDPAVSSAVADAAKAHRLSGALRPAKKW
jgi:hypothetical protein